MQGGEDGYEVGVQEEHRGFWACQVGLHPILNMIQIVVKVAKGW